MRLIEHSVVVGITNMTTDGFYKLRKRKTEPKLDEFRVGGEKKYKLSFDIDQLIAWMEVHKPIKVEVIKEYKKRLLVSEE